MAESLIFPNQLNAGDSYTQTYTLNGHTPANGWTLTCAFVDGYTTTEFTAVPVEQSYNLTITTNDTINLQPGNYSVIFYVHRTDERVTLTTHRLDVLPNPLTNNAGQDLRSFAEKMLEALEALLLKRATNGQLDLLKTTIDQKELERMSPLDLSKLRDQYKVKVMAQKGRLPKRVIYSLGQ